MQFSNDPGFLSSVDHPESPCIRAIYKRSKKENRRTECRRILRIPSGISCGALSYSFGGVSLAIDNNKGDTMVVTQMRNCLSARHCTVRLPVAPCRGGCDLHEQKKREILIPPYPNCIISHASPSRERLEIAKNAHGVSFVARKATGIANISSFSARTDPTATWCFLKSYGRNTCNYECKL